MSKIFVRSIFFAVLIVLTYGCAKEMQPIGGSKDINPPMSVSIKPPFYTTNFNAKKVSIKFNEFIQLVNQTRVVISPPLNHPLEINLKGKTVVISLKDTLWPNMTYNINFNDVIRDYTEGNISENFQYIFSTGDEIDTIFVSGKVFDASTGKPMQNIQVGLYFAADDSVVVEQKPNYYAITDKDGSFCIHNIKNTDYKVFALKDLSSDMLFNKPEEQTAFLNDRIKPEIYYSNVFDTLKVIKSINAENGDTLFSDSLVERRVLISSLGQLNMYMFTHDYKNQFVKNYSRPQRYLLNIVFNREPYRENNIYLENNIPLIQIPSDRPDSLLFLLPDTIISKRDSIKVICEYAYLDSLKKQQIKIDTLLFLTDKEKMVEDTAINIETNIVSGKIEMDESLKILFNHPIIDKDTLLVKLYQIEDTVKQELPFKVIWDSTYTIATIAYKYDNYYTYEFHADSLAFEDIYGYFSNPKLYKFKPLDYVDYGVLSVIVIGDYNKLSIFELVDQNGNVVWTKAYPSGKAFNIDKLKPGTYTLHLFVDKNQNKKRDTGSYFENILPEYIIPYRKDITIRANWDTEIEWRINID